MRLRVPPAWLWPLAVVAAVLLVNLPALMGLVDVSPLGRIGGTYLYSHPGVWPGAVYYDPNAGITAQTLGHLAAEDWLHGTVPWWNPFAGLGAPLAAGMQSAAFFPPTLLLALTQGQLLFHIVLEMTAALGTYFLARELRFSLPIAAAAGVAFGLEGTLARFGNATANPVCFLPIVIFGVERLCQREELDWPGWAMLALGLALSVYAGFPEVAYLDGLMAAAWLIFRIAQGPPAGRWPALARLAGGAVAGVLMSAPLAVAFVEYLPQANLGGHTGSFASGTLQSSAVQMLGLPYLYGPVGAYSANTAVASAWAGAGGYLTLPALALAGAGLVAAARERGLRIFLAVFPVIVLMWEFGLQPVQFILSHIVPGAGAVASYRYSLPGVELAIVLLACFGLEAAGRRSVLAGCTVAAVAAAVAGLDLAVAWPVIRTLWKDPTYHHFAKLTFAWAGATIAAVAGAVLGAEWWARRNAGRSRPRAVGAAVAGAVLALDAMVMFAAPQLSAPRNTAVDYGPPGYLSAHLGTDRFVSYRALNPDYGSYFGLGQIELIDLPIPKLWASYVQTRLQPGITIPYHFGQGTPELAAAIAGRLADYESSGVGYLVTAAGGQPPVLAKLEAHLRRVYDDGHYVIYAFPHPAPFFSTTGSACHLTWSGLDAVVASCPHPATLVRRELDLPSWSATVNGAPARMMQVDGAFSAVALPAGTSTVEYSYTPAHMDLALAAFGLGMAILAGVPVVDVYRRRLRRARRAGAVTI